MKIMTFNTQHCLNFVERYIDYPLMAKTILENMEPEKCILMGDFNVEPHDPILEAEVLPIVASDHFPHTAVINL